MGGGGRVDHPLNLMSVCRLCHIDIHGGLYSQKELVGIVAEREDMDDPSAFICWIRRQPKERPI